MGGLALAQIRICMRVCVWVYLIAWSYIIIHCSQMFVVCTSQNPQIEVRLDPSSSCPCKIYIRNSRTT
ncbi:hypothetical protein BJX70DRAFT_282135 [Aspergillus crustosus]